MDGWTQIWLGVLSAITVIGGGVMGWLKVREGSRVRELNLMLKESANDLKGAMARIVVLEQEHGLLMESKARDGQIIALLREQNRELGHLLSKYEQAARKASIETDLHGIIKRWDAGAAIMFGWSIDEAIGQDITELVIPPEERQRHKNGLEAVAYMLQFPQRQGKPQYRVREHPISAIGMHRDGDRFPCSIALSQPWPIARTNPTEWRIGAEVTKLELPPPGTRPSLQTIKDSGEYLPTEAEIVAINAARKVGEIKDTKKTDVEIPKVPGLEQ